MKPHTARDPRVRPATRADEPQIRALQEHLREPSPTLLEHGLAIGSAVVSDADGAVAGYALAIDAPASTGSHLAELVVAPAHRRAGRGRGLVEAIIEGATGAVTLQAQPDNDAALALYDACGFTVVDRRSDAYADSDALVLRRE